MSWFRCWLGSRQQIDKITVRGISVLSSSATTVDTARDLGVIVDSQLTMSAHVSAVCWSAYGYLRQLRPVTRVLSAEAANIVIHAFISSRLDYCNSLLFGISRQSAPASSGRTKCCSMSCYRYPTSWAHHARFDATSLAASATAHWIQTCSFGVQSDEWSVPTIFRGRLPAYLYCWPTTTTIIQRRHVWGSKNSH